jgi:hypothetical protein
MMITYKKISSKNAIKNINVFQNIFPYIKQKYTNNHDKSFQCRKIYELKYVLYEIL